MLVLRIIGAVMMEARSSADASSCAMPIHSASYALSEAIFTPKVLVRVNLRKSQGGGFSVLKVALIQLRGDRATTDCLAKI